ncbi:ribosomal protein L6P [Methanolacinia petrolearia DSM 11571]|uniref:Large ribosomal subunit protein uL6 n=1 Tax=Methanolacinia petrolearia (strain DSM 11571 / OCM 486 / SEBR 4847) TaxID=679926 RepID=E1RKD9_METP4|nr:50S ribosomal protein L6 [Methanolacinia petrolearia]ADN36952.1 ribosomal protein L6P [Methanolacinia petrolearia DSM 11571]
MITENRIEIPEGVNAEITGGKLVVSGKKGTLERLMRYPGITIRIEDGELIISTESQRKKIYAMLGTYASHAKNMFRGVNEEYEYGMKVVYSHFPIQLKEIGGKLEIVNFLGEKEPRYADIPEGVKMKIAGDEITLTGIDKELVGTTASRIEKATKVRGRDTRVFQDGIYIVSKA